MLRYVDYDIVFQEIPDETTLAINISNCPNRCPACHSPQLWNDTGEVLTEQVLLDLLKKYGKAITCVCFMGGDASSDEIDKLADFLHHQTESHVKVGWYSGKPALPSGFLLDNFQYLKLGPYIERLGGLRSRATNQRLYKIAGRELIDITSCYWK
jgi:anaerobic ribonucleoside-triphosphate reductase activating protein